MNQLENAEQRNNDFEALIADTNIDYQQQFHETLPYNYNQRIETVEDIIMEDTEEQKKALRELKGDEPMKTLFLDDSQHQFKRHASLIESIDQRFQDKYNDLLVKKKKGEKEFENLQTQLYKKNKGDFSAPKIDNYLNYGRPYDSFGLENRRDVFKDEDNSPRLNEDGEETNELNREAQQLKSDTFMEVQAQVVYEPDVFDYFQDALWEQETVASTSVYPPLPRKEKIVSLLFRIPQKLKFR
mmetsp:Transcript_41979/g.64275  ORF Transcript_41979/g.64275 Transcript_41979/m.64275 type:complete len:242 (-) Transcript_41979:1923-2648(-)